MPKDSFVIINIESPKIEFLNMSNILFVDDRISLNNLLFNFLAAVEINIAANSHNEVKGTFLAPHSKFYINGISSGEKIIFNGQIFVKEFFAFNFHQQCGLFEPFF